MNDTRRDTTGETAREVIVRHHRRLLKEGRRLDKLLAWLTDVNATTTGTACYIGAVLKLRAEQARKDGLPRIAKVLEKAREEIITAVNVELAEAASVIRTETGE